MKKLKTEPEKYTDTLHVQTTHAHDTVQWDGEFKKHIIELMLWFNIDVRLDVGIDVKLLMQVKNLTYLQKRKIRALVVKNQ